MSFKTIVDRFRLPALTLLGALSSVASTVHALDTCHLAIYHLPNQPSQAEQWRTQGFSIDVDQEIADYAPARVGRIFHAQRPGTALVFTTKSDFSLMMRPPWRDPNAPGGAASLSFNAAAFTKAFARTKPNCAALTTLVERAKFRFDASVLALAYLKSEPAGRAFSWSDFILSYENAMYLRDGVAIDSAALIETQRRHQTVLRTAARTATADLAGVGKITRLIFKQNNLGAYCSAGNTMSSAQLMSCTACQGSSTSIVAGLMDSGLQIPAPYHLGVQMFIDHWRPVLWDAKNLRLKDLTAGGGWITKVTDPIYKPEFLIDTLLRSPISGLSPEVIKALPARDPYYFVIVDANEEQSILPTWVQRKLKTPRLNSYSQDPQPSTGIARYFRVLNRSRYDDQPAPATGTLAFSDFNDDVVDEKGLGDRLGQGAPKDQNSSALPDTDLLVLMNLPDLSPADQATFDLLKQFAHQDGRGEWSWNLGSAGTALALEMQRVARANFTIGALAQRLGGGRLARNAKVDNLVKFQDLNLGDLIRLMSVSGDDVAALLARWENASLLDRAVLYDQTLQGLWTKATRNPRFDALLSYLERPVDSRWQISEAELEPLTHELWYLRGVARVAADFRLAIEGIHLQSALSRGDDLGTGIITGETQALYAALFTHAQNLAREYRVVVDRGNRWTPATTMAFTQFYHLLDLVTKVILANDLGLAPVRTNWPEGTRTPNLFRRRVTHPLQGVYENLLADAEFGAVYRRGQTGGRPARPSTTVGAAKSATPAINLPVVDWGIPDPCRGAAPGVLQISAGIAVECPEATRQESVSQGLTPDLAFALILNQPAQYLQTPDVQLRTTLLWTDEVEALAVKVGAADELHQTLFSPNPLMLNIAGDRHVTLPAPPANCARSNDLGWDWECVQANLPDQSTYRADATPDLGWLNLRPEYQAGYAKWVGQVKRYKFSKAIKDGDDLYFGTDGFWAGKEYVRRRVAVVEGKMVSVIDVMRAGFNRPQNASMTIESLSRENP